MWLCGQHGLLRHLLAILALCGLENGGYVPDLDSKRLLTGRKRGLALLELGNIADSIETAWRRRECSRSSGFNAAPNGSRSGHDEARQQQAAWCETSLGTGPEKQERA